MRSSHETMDVHQDRRRVFVTLDRPEVLNAQNETFLREFLEVTSGLVDRDDFDVVAVRSSSDHFGAGLDLKAAAEGWRLNATTVEWWEVTLHHLETIEQLVVALIDGFCLGGGLQLALACDLRIATDRATLAIPASREVGFLPGLAPWRLPRLIGIARAEALLLGGAVLTANQAALWGVVDQVAPTGGLEGARRSSSPLSTPTTCRAAANASGSSRPRSKRRTTSPWPTSSRRSRASSPPPPPKPASARPSPSSGPAAAHPSTPAGSPSADQRCPDFGRSVFRHRRRRVTVPPTFATGG